MYISLVADAVSIATNQGLGFSKCLIDAHDVASNNHVSFSDLLSDHSPSSSSVGVLQISAMTFPVDALAPPPVKSSPRRTAPRTLLRKKRRTRRRLFSGDSEDGGYEGFSGDGFDGPFGGDSGGGGRGWNFGGFGGHSWDEPPSSPANPAFNFVYEVIYWIAFSNCVHFAFKKVIRIVADGIGDAEREKVPLRFTSVC